MRTSHTTDDSGFDYMVNTGIEEKDRDLVGILLAVGLIIFVVLCQSFGLL